MYFTPYEKEQLKKDLWSKSRNFEILTKFAESNYDCVEVEDYPHKNAKSCQTTLISSMRHYKIRNIKVTIRGERVFLVKKYKD
jgi:hypothetical protein